MKVIFLLLLLSLSSLSKSNTLRTTVHSIDLGNNSGDQVMVMLSTGEVLWLSKKEESLIKEFQNAYNQKLVLKINFSTKKILSSSATDFKLKNFSFNQTDTDPMSYIPTIIQDEEELKKLFLGARRTSKPETQCFNRAHIWTYEWRINHRVFSSKTWLFFTRKFIRKYKFDWWFHVAPTLTVQVDGKLVEKIVDIKYAKAPLKMKSWTDIFVRDYADCPVVNRYSDYADSPEEGSCFVMKSSMYYYQPIDLEDLELTGIQKMKWIRGEVQEAYREAFDTIF